VKAFIRRPSLRGVVEALFRFVYAPLLRRF